MQKPEDMMAKPYRWTTPSGEHTAELRALIARARDGEPWVDIAAVFLPGRGNGIRRACDTFNLYASDMDRTERRDALARRGFNRIGKGGRPRGPTSDFIIGEPALKPEMHDPWAGMGACFARQTA